MNMKVVKTGINKSAIQLLEKTLESVKAGETIAVTIVSEFNNAEYSLQFSTSSTRTQTAGMLLDAAIKRLGYQYED